MSEIEDFQIRMTPFIKLTEVFDRAISNGVDSLSTEERELYLIQDFIIEHEMNGLSGYFYNRLSDLKQISSTVDAMRKYGLPELAAIVNDSFQLFQGYVDPDPPTTWSEVLLRYDPESRLDVLAKEIHALEDYGLANSRI